MPPKRPNIVFAFADDWGRYASAYAPHESQGSANHSLNELISTPHFDRSRFLAMGRRVIQAPLSIFHMDNH